ncbi:hypothetical protein HJG60_012013 [Phyllostomus discolor]|uniref:Uncharacterized protein n=1 Tax=Phyllostomus discolor TaxID=89673 RepID=A0A833ZL89_9CHIR|nr:hypothetical protein HJG60_012013 [Phyllostomus discolor]
MTRLSQAPTTGVSCAHQCRSGTPAGRSVPTVGAGLYGDWGPSLSEKQLLSPCPCPGPSRAAQESARLACWSSSFRRGHSPWASSSLKPEHSPRAGGHSPPLQRAGYALHLQAEPDSPRQGCLWSEQLLEEYTHSYFSLGHFFFDLLCF